MKEFFSKNAGILFLIALLLSLIVAGGSIIMTGSVDPISNAVGVLTTPIRSVVSGVTNWSEQVHGFIFHYEEMEIRVNELELQVAQMEEQTRDGIEAQRENEQLRELLNLQARRRDFVFESAKVTSRSFTSWESTISLNKGANAGIAIGDCVVTETGYLVGVISQVGENFSVISTLINTDISMGGLVSRTHSAGVLEGEFSLMGTGSLRLTYLPEEAQLMVGDHVVTSGLGDIYPSGLMVGKVESVVHDMSGLSRYAVITPEVDLTKLIEVFIIKDFEIID